MEISTRHSGDFVDVIVRGRLDAYWSNSLASALEELVRDGRHQIRLNLAEVAYLSSAGIRVLLKFYKQLQRIDGALVVSNPSQAVKAVLDLAGLQVLLEAPAAGAETAVRRHGRKLEHGGIAFDVYDQQPGGRLSCRAIGEPGRLLTERFRDADCRAVKFDASTFGVGLGAFGNGFDDCRGRFGEFLAAGGAATYLPTDGSNVPDYVVSAGSLLPEVRVLYALVCEGRFTHLARFEHPHGGHAVPLSELAAAALALADSEAAGLVMVAESAGLVGASLTRSPALEGEEGFFAHPGIRERLSYSPERSHSRSLALVAGVVTRAKASALDPFVRPVTGGSGLEGHFHAAAFSYRPLQKGDIRLEPLVATLFEAETLQAVLHLIGDDRQITGAGESEFQRGALWAGPIGEVTEE